MGNEFSIIPAWASEIKVRLASRPAKRQQMAIFEALDRIIEAGSRLDSLAVRLRRLAESEALEPFEIHDVVDEALSRLPSTAGVSPMRQYNAPRDVIVKLPMFHLQEVFAIICDNACDAMPHGGNLYVSSELTEFDGKSCVELYFDDTGAGVPDDVRAYLFRLLRTSKSGRGIGYGLWWAREFLRRHGGDLWLTESAYGSGARFGVRVPIEVRAVDGPRSHGL
jgi:signal transduction histidine kinase